MTRKETVGVAADEVLNGKLMYTAGKFGIKYVVMQAIKFLNSVKPNKFVEEISRIKYLIPNFGIRLPKTNGNGLGGLFIFTIKCTQQLYQMYLSFK